MSNISNRHNVLPFTSGESKALSGQRLCKVGYKSSATKPAMFPSVCVSVPFISTADIKENLNALLPHVQEYLGTMQDKIVRALYERSEGQLTSVSDEELSIPAITAYLEAESTGGKLSGEYLKSWFDESLSTAVQLIICEKTGMDGSTPEQVLKIEQATKGLRGLIEQFAAPNITFSPVQRTQLKNVLSLVPDDSTAERLIARLEAAEKKELEIGAVLSVFG